MNGEKRRTNGATHTETSDEDAEGILWHRTCALGQGGHEVLHKFCAIALFIYLFDTHDLI